MSDENEVRVPVEDAHGLWPAFYDNAVSHPLVALAHPLDEQVVKEPEVWLRNRGVELHHVLRPRDGRPERLDLVNVHAKGKRMEYMLTTSYWRFVAEWIWRPFLTERGWERIEPRFTDLGESWVAPSGKTYEVWSGHRTPKKVQWDGLGIALCREGLDPHQTLLQAWSSRKVAWSSRIRRWRRGVPPEVEPEVRTAFHRGWIWGSPGPFVGDDVAASASV